MLGIGLYSKLQISISILVPVIPEDLPMIIMILSYLLTLVGQNQPKSAGATSHHALNKLDPHSVPFQIISSLGFTPLQNHQVFWKTHSLTIGFHIMIVGPRIFHILTLVFYILINTENMILHPYGTGLAQNLSQFCAFALYSLFSSPVSFEWNLVVGLLSWPVECFFIFWIVHSFFLSSAHLWRIYLLGLE